VLALDILRRQGGPLEDGTVYTSIEKSYDQNVIGERLTAIALLGVLANKESVGLLIKFCTALNENNRSNTGSAEDERIMRAIVQAMGETKDPDCKNILKITTQGNWSNTIKNLVNTALTKVG
jgi:hypothetical protein